MNPHSSRVQCFNELGHHKAGRKNYNVKKVNDFPVTSRTSRDVTNQTLPGREYLNYSRPGRVWLVTSRLGTGKWQTFFYSVAPDDQIMSSEGLSEKYD
jgi:hypothetical protein